MSVASLLYRVLLLGNKAKSTSTGFGRQFVVPLSFGFLMAGLSGAIQHTSPLFLVNTVPAQGHRKRISNT